MVDVVVKCGKVISWDIKYGGEPDPEVKWFFNDQEIKTDER